ncbi:MAG: hypothetical protein FWG27_02510 [Treponema sp.]|nr:hypothetical protein [Treponema sp.]
MKKGITALILLAFLAAGTFAQGISFSMGGGDIVDMSFRNGIKDGGNCDYSNHYNVGVFLFFDATYAEADVSFSFGGVNVLKESPSPVTNPGGGYAMSLGFTLLGKYPFKLGPVTLFPLLGANYNMVLYQKLRVKDDDPMKNNQIGFLAGAGVDIPMSGPFYFRGEVLFQLRLPSTNTKDRADTGTTIIPLNPGMPPEPGLPAGDYKATLGMGPVIKFAVGYKL